MSKKVVYILSQVDKAVAFEWIVEEFRQSEIEVIFILINDRFDTPFSNFLKRHKVEFHSFPLKSKKTYPFTALKISRLLKKLKVDTIHAHLFEGGLIGLTAAKLAGIKTRIYTRHHSTSQHEYFPHAVKYDKLNNRLATKIVAISNNVKNVLKDLEGVPDEKITVVEHGFRLDSFSNTNQEKVEGLREKYKIPSGKRIIGTISRYVKLKGIDYVIDAFKEVHQLHPDTHLLLANAGGNYQTVIQEKLSQLPKDSYTEINFEPDLFSLYQLLNIYCHTPINSKVEAFGQTYIEALAAKVPSIFTQSGIANDFIKNEWNALVVDFENTQDIKEAMIQLLENDELANVLIKNGLYSVQQYQLTAMTEKLKRLYLS